MARVVAQTLVLAVLIVVVVLSPRRGAIALISLGLGLAAIATSVLPGQEWSPLEITMLRRGGDVLAFSALTWVVAHAVYARGRITSPRLQGAAVI